MGVALGLGVGDGSALTTGPADKINAVNVAETASTNQCERELFIGNRFVVDTAPWSGAQQ